jgi:membrane-bound lytic murein transglycosylase F
MIVSTGIRIARYVARIIFLFSILFIPSSCQRDSSGIFSGMFDMTNPGHKFLFSEIKSRGSLIAATTYNPTGYFIYHGEPMGYQYDKLKMFSDFLGVKLEIKVCKDLDEAYRVLRNGDCDIIAMGLTVNREQSEFVDFTDPHMQTRQVLVQHKPSNWRKMKSWDEVEKALVRDPYSLSGKTVYIERGSVYQECLASISDETRSRINVIEDPSRNAEQLIESVANGEIGYTVCNEYLAQVYEKFYQDIDVKTPLSFAENIAWAVPKGSDSLRMAANDWLRGYKETAVARYLFDKYYSSARTLQMAKNDNSSEQGRMISEYDDIIRKISAKYGLDWRLMASLIYQESHFKPNVQSWAGAYGLMQMMPGTAEKYGIDATSTASEQIEAGARFIRRLDKELQDDVTDPGERMKFVLGAYNVGIAHIFDARRLAKKYGRDPDVWTGNVDFYILNKSNPEYYKDTSVVRFGYAHGEETYNFVNEVLERYEHYKKSIDD